MEVLQIQFIDKVVDVPVNTPPAPGMEHVASTPATGYTASATAVTDIVATSSVNSDITDLMNPLLSITAGEASTLHVADTSLRKRKSSDTLKSPRLWAGARTQVQDDGIRHEIFCLEEAGTVYAAALTSPRTQTEVREGRSKVSEEDA